MSLILLHDSRMSHVIHEPTPAPIQTQPRRAILPTTILSRRINPSTHMSVTGCNGQSHPRLRRRLHGTRSLDETCKPVERRNSHTREALHSIDSSTLDAKANTPWLGPLNNSTCRARMNEVPAPRYNNLCPEIWHRAVRLWRPRTSGNTANTANTANTTHVSDSRHACIHHYAGFRSLSMYITSKGRGESRYDPTRAVYRHYTQHLGPPHTRSDRTPGFLSNNGEISIHSVKHRVLTRSDFSLGMLRTELRDNADGIHSRVLRQSVRDDLQR